MTHKNLPLVVTGPFSACIFDAILMLELSHLDVFRQAEIQLYYHAGFKSSLCWQRSYEKALEVQQALLILR